MSLSNKLKAMGESYTNDIAARSFIQTMIPVIGSALDMIMAGYGSQIQQDRFYALLDSLGKRLDALEDTTEIEPNEELFDLFRVAVENSVRTRSEGKRQRFANIMANALVSDSKPWDEAETAMRLIGDLEEIHMSILIVTADTHEVIGNAFNGLKAVKLEDTSDIMPNYIPPLNLLKALPQYDPILIQMGCAELVSKGLLKDIGSSGWNAAPLQTFVSSKLADWLIQWISSDNKN